MSKKNELRIKEEAGRQFAFEEAGVHICRWLGRERKVLRERERERGGLEVAFNSRNHETGSYFLDSFWNEM